MAFLSNTQYALGGFSFHDTRIKNLEIKIIYLSLKDESRQSTEVYVTYHPPYFTLPSPPRLNRLYSPVRFVSEFCHLNVSEVGLS